MLWGPAPAAGPAVALQPEHVAVYVAVETVHLQQRKDSERQ